MIQLLTCLAAALLSCTAPAPGAPVAQETSGQAPSQVLFQNVRVWDGTSESLSGTLQVLVEGNRIKAIGNALGAGDGATVIDGGGRTLMPGLIDSHVHFNLAIEGGLKEVEAARWDQIGAFAAAAAREWLMDGFTTVRGMGGMGNGLQEAVDTGLLVGPRIYPSGSYISQTSGHGDILLGSQSDPEMSNLVRLGIAQLADGPDAVRAAVRRNFAVGASQIKIMVGGGISSEKGPLFAEQYTDEEVRAAVEEAATRDTYVAVHVYQDAHIRRALELGVKSIEHGQFITEETALLLKEKGAFIAPFVNGLTPESLLHPVYGKPGSPQNQKALEFQEDSRDFVTIMQRVQPKIAFAIDVVNLNGENARKNRDFEKFAFARFFGNHAALRAMTSTPGELAALTGRNNPYPGKLGVIEEGALADILIVEGNPLEDIAVIGGNPKFFDAEPRGEGIETIRVIMKDGMVYKNTLGPAAVEASAPR
ncbi:MAG: metal-dependent hydrolase family protein [Planctomycetota bacterium]|jgi:imidazolonepropionase-like amidohydrolase